MSSRRQNNKSMTVLAVDGHPLMRGGLGELLRQTTERLELLEASHPDEGLRLVSGRVDVDLIFLDAGSTHSGNLAYVERFRAAAPGTPLIFSTLDEEPASLRRAIELGAAAVVPKTHSRRLVQMAIELVMEGGCYAPPELLRSLAAGASVAREELVQRGPRTGGMSPQQKRILQFLAEGVSNKQIARELGIAPSTVKNQLTAVFDKLGVSNRTQAAIAARALQVTVLSQRPGLRS